MRLNLDTARSANSPSKARTPHGAFAVADRGHVDARRRDLIPRPYPPRERRTSRRVSPIIFELLARHEPELFRTPSKRVSRDPCASEPKVSRPGVGFLQLRKRTAPSPVLREVPAVSAKGRDLSLQRTRFRLAPKHNSLGSSPLRGSKCRGSQPRGRRWRV